MSLLPTGQHICDSCGVDVGNGGVYAAATVSVLVSGDASVLHLCLDRQVPADSDDVGSAMRVGATVVDEDPGTDLDGTDPNAVLPPQDIDPDPVQQPSAPDEPVPDPDLPTLPPPPPTVTVQGCSSLLLAPALSAYTARVAAG